MPIWTLDELQACRVKCFDGIVLEQKVIDNFNCWGGSARQVFWSGDNQDIQKRLLQATANYSTMESIVTRMTSVFTDKHPYRRHQWLWHMVVDETYRKYRYQWPSVYIQSEIFKKIEMMEWSYKNRNKLIQSSSSINAGNIYDAYVKSIFLKFPNGFLTIKNRTTSETCQVPYPTKGIYFYLTKISCERNTLYVPFLKNQASVDLVYPPYMIQITQAKDHAIKDEEIEEVKTIFHTVKDDEWKLCFIVPWGHSKHSIQRNG